LKEGRKQSCPICEKEVSFNARYPRYICPGCSSDPVDETGKSLVFFNVSITGGFEARYSETDQARDSHICYVSGVKCYADEARFGGIVIQVCEE
jgi:hypothetical protein